MKSLQTIQKTFRVFQILTKIAMILSFVWAGLALLGMLCGAVWYGGGTVVGVGQAQLYSLTKTGGLIQMIAVLMTDAILALTDGTLLAFALAYFKAEQADGTPFTQRGAEQIKRLGIRTIVLPLVAAIVAAVIYAAFDLPQGSVEWSNLTSLGLGIVLILASLIFRYGAELEAGNASGNEG
ncbi:MAG: hypothetical protein ACI3VA_07850 [Candidatus Limivicinus sp.]